MQKLARHVTLRQLQIFEAIGRLKNFTRVAEELFLTQSTVSTQVKNLADLAGTPLVEVVGKKTYLTQAGEIMFQTCQNVIGQLDRTENDIAELVGCKKGTLRLSVISTAKFLTPQVLGKFWESFPEFEVSLVITNQKNIINRLENNEDDLYIWGQKPAQNLEVNAVAFTKNPIYVMAGKNHPLVTHNQRLSLKELAAQPLILREPGSGIRDDLDAMFTSKGLVPNIRMELSNNESIKHALIGKLGISVLSLHSILLEGNTGPITLLNVEGFPIRREMHLVYRKSKTLSMDAEAFIQFLQDEGKLLTQQIDKLANAIDPVLNSVSISN